MTINSIKYALKEGIKNVWINRLMSVSSVIVMISCLVLTGISILLSENLKNMLKSIEGQNSITIYLQKDATFSDIQNVENRLNGISNIATCTFFSKDEAYNEYKDKLDELNQLFNELEITGVGNPLPDAFHITMKDLSLYDETVHQLKNIDGISSISDRSEIASKLTQLYNLVTRVGLFIVLLLSLISLFIISNTIKITMYNRRHEISIMKSVGATNSFIRLPFLIEGLAIGIISALLAVEVLKFSYTNLVNIINDVIPFKTIPIDKVYINIFVGFMIFGMIFGIMGGVISISKYLKSEGDNLAKW